MNFRTNIKPKPEQNQLDYTSNLLLIGSCFTQNIGDKLSYYKFENTVNPFGILFQPKAIEKLIVSSLTDEVYTEKDLFFHNERWHCFDVHSDLSNAKKEVVLTTLNKATKQLKKELQTTSHIVITLGTAWVYRNIESTNLVANCHKVSQKQFKKEILSVTTITTSLSKIINVIKAINPSAKVIFTLSPVRHLKDGFIENQQSKSHLLSAIHQIIEENKISYFPAYEIMMDDLRDYRFYKKDMLHPNEIAIDYIWQQFVYTWINPSATAIMKQVNQIQKGLAHKPFNQASEQHQCFLRDLQMQMDELDEKSGIQF